VRSRSCEQPSSCPPSPEEQEPPMWGTRETLSGDTRLPDKRVVGLVRML
jgi:hypothetical protein